MKKRKLFISFVISLLTGLILLWVTNGLSGGLTDQNMADRWSEKKDAAQISCFFSSKAGIDKDSIEMFRHSIDSALQEASVIQDSPNANARLWADAYSADGQITIVGNKATVTADAIGVGGDFFLFHPLQLRSGAYFAESDLNQDYCILDEDAAWQLFGSNDIAGKTVSIGGAPHVVAGVARRGEGHLEKAAGLDGMIVYVSYQTLEQYGTTAGINHYEIVMPNPVSKFAYNLVKEKLASNEKETVVLENTSRYGITARIKILSLFGTRSMNEKAIIFPYWENVARGYEDIIALLTLIAFGLLLYALVLFLIFVIRKWKRKKWTWKSLWRRFTDKLERKAEKRREKRKRKKLYQNQFDEEEYDA